MQLQSPLSVLCAFPLQAAAPSDLHLVSSEMEVLKRPAREVKVFNEDLARTSTKMLEVMYSSGGIGLAGVNVIIVKLNLRLNMR
jgi:peptide deformylase